MLCCAWAFCVGLIYSKVLLSMSMIAFAFTLFLPYDGRTLKARLARVGQRRALWLGPLLIFVGVLLSGINSSDSGQWLHMLQIKLPLLFVPIAAAALPSLRRKRVVDWLQLFASIVAFSTLPVVLYYALHSDEVHKLLGQGRAFPTPTGHIRYSLFIAFGALSSLMIYLRRLPGFLSPRLSLVIGLWLTAILHLIAVRSGLLCYYGAGLAVVLMHLLRRGRYGRALATLAAVGGCAALLITALPTLQAKFHYMKHDLHQMIQGRTAFYSDAQRLQSIQIGGKIFADHPTMGTGLGDLADTCRNYYDAAGLQGHKSLYPHNQYVFMLAGTGILGFLIFGFGLAWPLIHYDRPLPSIWWSLHLIVLLSMLVENTLERSVGLSFYIVPMMILWMQSKTNRD